MTTALSVLMALRRKCEECVCDEECKMRDRASRESDCGCEYCEEDDHQSFDKWLHETTIHTVGISLEHVTQRCPQGHELLLPIERWLRLRRERPLIPECLVERVR